MTVVPHYRIKKGARRPAVRFQLMSGGAPLNIAGATVVMKFRIRGSTDEDDVVTRPMSIVSAATGVVEYNWEAGETAALAAGYYDLEFVVTFSDGTPQRFPEPEEPANPEKNYYTMLVSESLP